MQIRIRSILFLILLAGCQGAGTSNLNSGPAAQELGPSQNLGPQNPITISNNAYPDILNFIPINSAENTTTLSATPSTISSTPIQLGTGGTCTRLFCFDQIWVYDPAECPGQTLFAEGGFDIGVSGLSCQNVEVKISYPAGYDVSQAFSSSSTSTPSTPTSPTPSKRGGVYTGNVGKCRFSMFLLGAQPGDILKVSARRTDLSGEPWTDLMSGMVPTELKPGPAYYGECPSINMNQVHQDLPQPAVPPTGDLPLSNPPDTTGLDDQLPTVNAPRVRGQDLNLP